MRNAGTAAVLSFLMPGIGHAHKYATQNPSRYLTA